LAIRKEDEGSHRAAERASPRQAQISEDPRRENRRHPVPTHAYRRWEEASEGELRFDGMAGCLRTPGGGSSKQFVVVVEAKSSERRALTSRECARLMTIPDDYDFPLGDSRPAT